MTNQRSVELCAKLMDRGGATPGINLRVATSVSRGDSKWWKVTIWRLRDAPGEVRFTKLEVQNYATSVG